MKHLRRTRVAFCLIAALATSPLAFAQQAQAPLKIGVLTDMTGPYSAIGGVGLVKAVEMAVTNYGGKVLDRPIEVLSANYQSSVDVAATQALRWYDQDGVSMIIESTDSAAAGAVEKIAAQKHKIFIIDGSASTALTDQGCNPYSFQWTYDTYALANGTARTLVKNGGKTWYFITADYAFGKSLQNAATHVIEGMGAKVIGSSKHPLNGTDFSAILLKAQASHSDIIGLADAGKDTQNVIRQAAQFGITKHQTVAPLLLFDSDVTSIGLRAAQGLYFTTAFYWDESPQARAFSNAYFSITHQMPDMVQAGGYSATTAYLQAVAKSKTTEADVVASAIHNTPINDFFAHNGKVRADGLMLHDMYLAKVKTPKESKNKWDIEKIVATIPGADAFPPLAEEKQCKLLAHQ